MNAGLDWQDEHGAMRTACAVAGVLAECGVRSLRLSDPRACATLTLLARQADFPKAILDAAPGSVFAGDGWSLQRVDSGLRWAGSGEVVEALSRLG